MSARVQLDDDIHDEEKKLQALKEQLRDLVAENDALAGTRTGQRGRHSCTDSLHMECGSSSCVIFERSALAGSRYESLIKCLHIFAADRLLCEMQKQWSLECFLPDLCAL